MDFVTFEQSQASCFLLIWKAALVSFTLFLSSLKCVLLICEEKEKKKFLNGAWWLVADMPICFGLRCRCSSATTSGRECHRTFKLSSPAASGSYIFSIQTQEWYHFLT